MLPNTLAQPLSVGCCAEASSGAPELSPVNTAQAAERFPAYTHTAERPQPGAGVLANG